MKAWVGDRALTWALGVERVTGIEPALSAREDHVIGPDVALSCSFECPPGTGGDRC